MASQCLESSTTKDSHYNHNKQLDWQKMGYEPDMLITGLKDWKRQAEIFDVAY